MNDTRRTGILLALVTAVISGFAVFTNSYAVKSFGDATVYTTAKNLVAGLALLLVVSAGSRFNARLTRPGSPGQWGALAVIGVFGGSVPFVLFFEGLSRASSTQAAFLHKTLVLWVAVLAVAFLSERLHWGHWLAIGLLIVGQIGLLGGVGGSMGAPEAMILAATLMWAVEVVLAKRLLGSLSSWTVAVARMGLGSLALVGWLAVRGDLGMLTSLTAEQLVWVVVTGLILAAYVGTWFAALQRAPAVDVTAVLVLAVPITAALDALAKGTPLAPQLGWLALLLLGGSMAAALGWRGRRTAVPVAA